MFYRVTVGLKSPVEDLERLRNRNEEVSSQLRREEADNANFSIVRISNRELTIYGTTFVRFEHIQGTVEGLIDRFLQACEIEAEKINIQRMSYRQFTDRFQNGNRRNRNNESEFLVDLETFYDSVNHYSFRYLDVEECFVEEERDLEASSFTEALEQETLRIKALEYPRFSGHPIHYKILSDRVTDAYEVAKQLTYRLFTHHRLVYPYLVLLRLEREPNDLNSVELEGIDIAYGGACFLDLSDAQFVEYDLAMLETYLRRLADIMRGNRHQILFYIYSNSPHSRVLRILDQYLSSFSLVELKEDQLSRKNALALLKETLKEVSLDPKLSKDLLPKGDYFYVKDVVEIFHHWYDGYLKQKLYPQYQSIPQLVSVPIIDHADSGYQQLQDMIGLAEIKQMIDEYLGYQKALRLYESQDIHLPKMTRHMVFTGNPGTAKTTVARLIGQILKENRLLSVGDFYEVSRADLIDKYVGWTARNVKKHFKRAMGSILFIDEAYSLMDGQDHRQSYGDEAIATIMQEMENHRDDIVVIFAGYTKEMKAFLDSNPGLASRIGFSFDFKDYSVDELLQISNKIASDLGFTLDAEVLPILKENIKILKRDPHFGNGRTIRNLIEQAILRHGSKLCQRDAEGLSREELCTLRVDDFNRLAIPIPEYLWHRDALKEFN